MHILIAMPSTVTLKLNDIILSTCAGKQYQFDLLMMMVQRGKDGARKKKGKYENINYKIMYPNI